jgi:hypothetical protein
MHSFKISVVLAGMAFISGDVYAYSPPIPPPDPVRLAAASDLIAVLPIESAVSTYNNKYLIREEVTKVTLDWLRQQPNFIRDELLEQIFVAKIRLKVDSQFSAAVRDVTPAIAEDYARRLSEQDIVDAKVFVLTPNGQNFVRLLLEEDRKIINRVRERIYRRISEELPQLLQSARESHAILKQVNRKP